MKLLIQDLIVTKHIPLSMFNLNFVRSFFHSNTLSTKNNGFYTHSLSISLQFSHLPELRRLRLLEIFADLGQLGYRLEPVYYFKTSRIQTIIDHEN